MEASPIFSPGQTVSIQTPDRTLTLTIDRPFAPFTKAVVLLARSPQLGPDPVVVKIYDPRFLDERLMDTPHHPARPWSLEAERAADALMDDPFQIVDLYKVELEDAEGRAARAALWEKYFRICSTDSFTSEREVYDRLAPLQGSTIPRLLLTGTLLPPDERAIQPHAVVIEYIPDAVSLADVPVEVVEPELCATLLRVVDSFASHGVIHWDMHMNNILFAPRERPTRVVVIDFGHGEVREEDQDEDAWRQRIVFSNESRHVRSLLRRRGIAIPTV
ncbi:hypothetical protein LXA43DRAFT_1077470 [Ganoderma leucocontextum]|nr:hypothetical protein LXA43DRAFT_1077470 [Ganoderma leucocontextum]